MTERTDRDWTFHDFGEQFDTHVAAHLPGYADVQRLIGLIASMQVPVDGGVADLGCSTGTSALTIAGLDRDIHFWLYDTDRSMLDQARARLAGQKVLTTEGDVREGMVHHGADLTLALWLLQFIPQADWWGVLSKARQRSRPTGMIIIAARTRFTDSRWESIGLAALDDYKADQGVSADERAAKTRSLRGVQGTWPASDYIDALLDAGWWNPAVLWRWHVWTVIGAWASPVRDDPA